jgi:adenosylmethionine-8-amino-7-oxononanoate aminotransferase
MKRASPEAWRRRDLKHLWHPYTDMAVLAGREFPVIQRAQGCRLHTVDGRRLWDGISSWWCVNLGHGQPRLVRAIQRQARALQHVMLGGMSHPNAIALAEKLAQLAPPGLRHVFFAGDGSSAVEAALRMALQYWTNIGDKKRRRFISLQDGYHGDTLGAVGVGYVETFHKELKALLPRGLRAASPHCARCPCRKKPGACGVECFDSMARLIEEHHRETAAVVIEPFCQAAAGMRLYPDEYLRRLRALCSERRLLLIADEIAVGFGRTGRMFACERAGIAPDIMTVGKGLTGGYLPLSAAMANDRVYDSFHRGRTFYYGQTFCGNPIATAAALAALSVYADEKIIARLPPRCAQLERGMRALLEYLPHSFAAAAGMVAMVEIHDRDGGARSARAIAQKALELGLLIRPLGPVIYLWPPLVATEGELGRMLDILRRASQNGRM